MTEILLLPLDDRPCNRLFPVKLGKIAGLRVLTPPRELLGAFTTPGVPERLVDWLLESAPRAQAVIGSVEMLCYGGLIASRDPAVPAELAESRLQVLRRLKKLQPHLPIYASNVIMRLSITADSPEKIAYWRDVALYSQLVYRVEVLGQSRWEEALAAIRRRIPDEVLGAYLAARRRNHTVSAAAVRMLADGVLEQLVLCQEDAAPIGLHVPEREALISLAQELNVAERLFLHPGADESGLTLLTRAVCDLEAWHPRISASFGSQEGAQRVALYEDRPIAENVLGHILAAGAAPIRDPGKADLALFVHTPIGPQREAARRDSETERRSLRQAHRLAQRVAERLRQGVPVAVADIAYCNGADPALVDALLQAEVMLSLAGYAGWNTAGNSIGTALAQGVLWVLASRRGSTPSRRLPAYQLNFLFERLVEDLLYQSGVRQEANAWIENSGLSMLSLGDAKEEVEAFVSQRLKRLARKVFTAHFKGKMADTRSIETLRKLTVRLPWPRTFEVEVEAELTLRP